MHITYNTITITVHNSFIKPNLTYILLNVSLKEVNTQLINFAAFKNFKLSLIDYKNNLVLVFIRFSY